MRARLLLLNDRFCILSILLELKDWTTFKINGLYQPSTLPAIYDENKMKNGFGYVKEIFKLKKIDLAEVKTGLYSFGNIVGIFVKQRYLGTYASNNSKLIK